MANNENAIHILYELKERVGGMCEEMDYSDKVEAIVQNALKRAIADLKNKENDDGNSSSRS